MINYTSKFSSFKQLAHLCVAIAASFALSVQSHAQETAEKQSGRTLWSHIKANPQLSEFAKWIELAELDEFVRGDSPVTLFAPTNKALSLLRDDERTTENARKLIKAHLVVGNMQILDQENQEQRLLALSGNTLSIYSENNAVFVEQIPVSSQSIQASNGVLYIIGEPLAPLVEKMVDTPTIRDIIRTAIRKGAPIYNEGGPEACAAIYEIAIMGVLSNPKSELEEPILKILRNALVEVRDPTTPSKEHPWIYRRALDKTLFSLD